MKRIVSIIIVLITTLSAMAQATQPCVVKQNNQKQLKTTNFNTWNKSLESIILRNIWS